MDFRNRKEGEDLKMINLHSGHRRRLRNSLNGKGWENFDDHQILEYMLQCVLPRKDTNPLAHMLIEDFGSFSRVLDAKKEDLEKIDGVGERVATFLTSYPYIFKLYKQDKIKERPNCSTPKAVFDAYGEVISHMPNEEFYLICVDGDSRAISSKMISRGTNNEVSFAVKTVSEIAIRNQAHGVILLHNHPNKDCRPSPEDIEMTRRLFYVMFMNGIYLIDHLITSNCDTYYSFSTDLMLEKFEKEAKFMANGFNQKEFKGKRPEYNDSEVGENYYDKYGKNSGIM